MAHTRINIHDIDVQPSMTLDHVVQQLIAHNNKLVEELREVIERQNKAMKNLQRQINNLKPPSKVGVGPYDLILDKE